MNNSLVPLLWFLAILALIPVVLWLLKRTPLGGAALGGQLRTVAQLVIAPSQRIVIVEVGQEPVNSPQDVTKRLEALKKEGKKSALLLVSNGQGEVRFVAVAMN